MPGMDGFINKNKKTTHQGGKAYEPTLLEKLYRFFTTGLIQGRYYQSEEEVIRETTQMLSEGKLLHPEEMARMAAYGRNVGMKLAPNLGLLYLSTLEDKKYYDWAFTHVIKTPKDLHDHLHMARKAGIRRGVGSHLKKIVGRHIQHNLSDYHACKYKGKLQEILRIARPQLAGDAQDRADYIINGNRTFPRARALEEVRDELREDNVTEKVLETIKEHRIQMDEIKFTFGGLSDKNKEKIYRAFIPGMSYMALVMNLVSITRAFPETTRTLRYKQYSYSWVGSREFRFVKKPFETGDVPDDIIEMVADKLRDYEAMKRSRMLPFRLIQAMKMTTVPEWREALRDMIAKACADSLDIGDKKVLLGVDTSGSMFTQVNRRTNSLRPVEQAKRLTMVEIASLLGAMIEASIGDNVDLCAVATDCERISVNEDDTPFDVMESIMKKDVGMGSYFEQLMQLYDDHDYIILVSDGMQAGDLERAWLEQRKEDCKLIVWQLDGYTKKITNHPDGLVLNGYSGQIVSLIKKTLEDGVNPIDEVLEYGGEIH